MSYHLRFLMVSWSTGLLLMIYLVIAPYGLRTSNKHENVAGVQGVAPYHRESFCE